MHLYTCWNWIIYVDLPSGICSLLSSFLRFQWWCDQAHLLQDSFMCQGQQPCCLLPSAFLFLLPFLACWVPTVGITLCFFPISTNNSMVYWLGDFLQGLHDDFSCGNVENNCRTVQWTKVVCNTLPDLSKVGGHCVNITSKGSHVATMGAAKNWQHVGWGKHGQSLFNTFMVERDGHSSQSSHQLWPEKQIPKLHGQMAMLLQRACFGQWTILSGQPTATRKYKRNGEIQKQNWANGFVVSMVQCLDRKERCQENDMCYSFSLVLSCSILFLLSLNSRLS